MLYLIVLAVQSDTVPTVTAKRDIDRRLCRPNSQFNSRASLAKGVS